MFKTTAGTTTHLYYKRINHTTVNKLHTASEPHPQINNVIIKNYIYLICFIYNFFHLAVMTTVGGAHIHLFYLQL